MYELLDDMQKIRILGMNEQGCKNIIIIRMILLINFADIRAFHPQKPLLKQAIAPLLPVVHTIADYDNRITMIRKDSAEYRTNRICDTVILRCSHLIAGIEIERIYMLKMAAVLRHIKKVGHIHYAMRSGKLIRQIVERLIIIGV